MGKDSKHLTHLGEDELLWPDGRKVRTAGHTTLQLKYYDTAITIPAVVCQDVEGYGHSHIVALVHLDSLVNFSMIRP